MCQSAFDSMRLAQESTLTQDCEVLRWTPGKDSTGAYIGEPGDGPPTNRFAYKCRVVAKNTITSGREVRTAPGEIVLLDWLIKLKVSADVRRETDRIQVGNNIYEIIDMDRGRVDATLLTVHVREPIKASEVTDGDSQ